MEKDIELTPSLFLKGSKSKISECIFYHLLTSEALLPLKAFIEHFQHQILRLYGKKK
jgi:hypothetical protein